MAEITVYGERYGDGEPLGEATMADAVGTRPNMASARQAWHRVNRMVEQLRSGAESTVTQPDLPDIG